MFLDVSYKKRVYVIVLIFHLVLHKILSPGYIHYYRNFSQKEENLLLLIAYFVEFIIADHQIK